MESQRKSILITAVVLGVLIIGAGVLYWWYYMRPPAPAPVVEPPKVQEPSPPPPPAEPKPAEEKEPAPEPAVTLPAIDQSDDFVKQTIKGLSPHGKIADWMKIKNLIRVITAAVDNIARGESPRAHLGFLFYGQVFSVGEKGGKLYLHPKSYGRYDLLADAFVSLNTGRTVQAYQKLKPLFQEAYRELGYPEKDFHATLIQAI
ncbi:MAG: hypothetical protein AMJ94_17465, partial [Deltaproteobacteria bacterium SM23_61]